MKFPSSSKSPAVDVVAAVFILSGLLASPANAATIPAIFSSTAIIAAIVPQALTVAKADTVTIGTSTVDAWMSTATIAFQQDNSAEGIADVVCPVRIYREGVTISTFSGHDDLATPADKAFLYGLPEWVTIIKDISLCGKKEGDFSGCTQAGGSNAHLVIIDDLQNMLTFGHEYIHLGGGKQHFSCPPSMETCPEMRYTMFENNDPRAAKNILTLEDCQFAQAERVPRP